MAFAIACKVLVLFVLFANSSHAMINHGKPKEGTYSCPGALASLVVIVMLLAGAGFFNL